MASSDAEAGDVDGDRHHQPARDDRGLGPRDRRAGLQRDRLAGHADRRHRRASWPATRASTACARTSACRSRPTSRGRRSSGSSTTSTARASAPRPANWPSAPWTPGCSGTSPAARTAASTRPTSPTPAATMLMNLETLDWHEPSLDLMGDPAARCCRRSSPRARPTARRRARRSAACRWRASSATSRRRCSARPASTRGDAKNTYGTGSFLLVNTGEEIVHTDKLLTTVGGEARPRRAARLHARGLDRGDRRARSSGCATGSGSSRTRPKSKSWRSPSTTTAASTSSPPSPASSPRTGAKTPAGSIVGLTGYANKGHIARADAGGDRLAEPRGGRRRQRRRRRALHRAASRRRHDRQRAADAVPGRRPRRAGDPPRGDRDDRARRRLRRRPRGRLLVRHRRAARALGRGQALGAEDGRGRARAPVRASGRRRSNGPSTGRTTTTRPRRGSPSPAAARPRRGWRGRSRRPR